MAVVGDETGRILGSGIGGPTNYQITGIETAMKHVGDAVATALGTAGLRISQIDNTVFGLAGADFPIDFENLTTGLSGLYPQLKFTLTNDTWVGFRAGTEKDFGGVVIAGTGANYAAASPDGSRITGRGMGYEWGSEGGAGSLIREVMHYAFRSHDGTGPKTGLEEAVLSLLEFPSYDDLSAHMYSVHGEFGHMYMKVAQLVPALFELAFRGDPVAQDILVKSGTVMGEIIGGMMARLGMQAVESDVVLVGSIFTKGVCPLMVSALRIACQRQIPLAVFRPVEMEPAAGGFLMALEGLGVDVKGQVRQTAMG
jgi:N-acetylglucosamine kinase-like BadF-type ATPase